MFKNLKNLRVQINGLAKLTSELKPIKEEQCAIGIGGPYIVKTNYYNSNEIDNAVHQLMYAKAWLGRCLKEQGSESPYKSGYKTKEDIEPVADKESRASKILDDINWFEKSHIEKVDWLRTEIEKIIEEFKISSTFEVSRALAVARNNAYTYLCEARFSLGFELQRIKEEK